VALPGFEVVGFENRYRARNGQWRWLRWNGRADGYRWIAVAIDVTDEVGIGPAMRHGPSANGSVAAQAVAPPVVAPSTEPAPWRARMPFHSVAECGPAPQPRWPPCPCWQPPTW